MTRPRFRLLLIHNEPRLLEIFEQAALFAGGELVEAGSYERAVERVSNEHFEAVVISPVLPNFSRQGFARVVRNSRLNSQSSVTLLTGTRGRGRAAPEAGEISMLQRPMHADDLAPFFKHLTRALRAERRGQRRLSFRTNVQCVKGLTRFQATSVNLGTTGMLLDLLAHLRLNEEMELHFNLEPTRPALVLRARVLRMDTPGRVGVIFQGLSSQSRQLISQFIDQHLPDRT